MDQLFTFSSLAALLTLTILEIILGIDNVVFLSILVDKLPEMQRERARKIGLGLAMGVRVLLLLTISWITTLTNELFSIFGHGISGKDLVLILGGLFLLAKATREIAEKTESHSETGKTKGNHGFRSIIAQIVMMDIIFSLDSVITAVGMAKSVIIMIAAVIIAIAIMMRSAKFIGEFIGRHPSLKVLALAFLVLIGVTLIAEGWGQHVNKGYIYFAMFFSFTVEMINLRLRKRAAD
ncbi:MAG: TerC family protein [bacterium]|nr:TerC family protein [bacterium]